MSSADGVGLESTPTYSVAVTALFFISISLIVERAIHRLKKYLKRKNQKPLRKVLDKMTEELMLLGFISLLLTVLQSSLVKICVSPGFSSHLLPCGAADYASVSAPAPSAVATTLGRRLLNIYLSAVDVGPRRQLMAESLGTGRCAAKASLKQLCTWKFVMISSLSMLRCEQVGKQKKIVVDVHSHDHTVLEKNLADLIA